MSISVAIGSDIIDIHNIEDTMNILKLTRNVVANGSLSLPDQDTPLDSDHIDNLLDWYNGIYNILTNPSIFSLEEVDS